MRVERVVVGIDFNRASIVAADWVGKWFAPNAEVTLVHCLAPTGERREHGIDRLLAETRLHDVHCATRRQRVRHEVRIGDTTHCLRQAAAELHADLIVVGPHNDRQHVAEQLGSTAELLVQSSPVPVLLATGSLDGPPERILVPLDESPITAAAADWVASLAARFNARVAVLHVQGVREPELVHTGVGVGERWRQPAGDPTVPWERMIAGCAPDHVMCDELMGDPATVVLGEARRFGTELVVFNGSTSAASQHSGLGAAISQVLRSSACSVLVLVGKMA